MRYLIITIVAYSLTLLGLKYLNASPIDNIANEIIAPKVQNVVQPPSQKEVNIEAVFVLDTTSSMSGLIQTAKEKIWSIASNMASSKNNASVKIGLVAFRDRGDTYVTKVIPLTNDLDSVYATLMDFKADGGGDTPEAVFEALDDALNKITWSQDKASYRSVFLIGDAIGHSKNGTYGKTVTHSRGKYRKKRRLLSKNIADLYKVAKTKNIHINTIQSGQSPETAAQWRHIASLSRGDYFQVKASGNAVAINSPFDKELAEIATELDNTRMFYGTKSEQKVQEKHKKNSFKINSMGTVSSRARRAVYNSKASGKKNFLKKKELINEISSGETKLSAIPNDQLPTELKDLSEEEQQQVIKSKTIQRQELESKTLRLTEKRKQYLKEQASKTKDIKNSIDHKIFNSIQKQASNKGIQYSKEDIEY